MGKAWDDRFTALLPDGVTRDDCDGAPVARAMHDALLADPRMFDLVPRLARTDQSNNYRPRTFANDPADAADKAALDAFYDAMQAAAQAMDLDALLAAVEFCFRARLSALSGAVVEETFRRLRALESADAVRTLLGMSDKHEFENAEIERMTNTSAGEVLEVDKLNQALLRENESADECGVLGATLRDFAPTGQQHKRFTVATLRAMQDARVDTRALLAQ